MLQRTTAMVMTVICIAVAGLVVADDDPTAQPDALVVRVLAATYTETEQLRGVSISVELSNPHDESVTFLGYTPESFDPPLEEGQISPFYRIEFKRDGEWAEHRIGWCGTGMRAIELKPDAKPMFGAFAAGAENWEAVRVGIWRFDSTDEDTPPTVVWSEEFTNEPAPGDE